MVCVEFTAQSGVSHQPRLKGQILKEIPKIQPKRPSLSRESCIPLLTNTTALISTHRAPSISQVSKADDKEIERTQKKASTDANQVRSRHARRLRNL
eukprot:434358-Pyramimonas_sp.AAC.2